MKKRIKKRITNNKPNALGKRQKVEIKASKLEKIIAEELQSIISQELSTKLKESFRPYDAGYQTTDDERRADNRKKQKAAEEHAEKMAVARDEEEHGSAMWKWYDASYERHDANAMLDSPIPVSDVREPPLPKGKTEDEQVHGGGFDDRNFEKGADRGMIEKFLGFELPAGETISGALKAAFKKWNKRRLQNADKPGLEEEIATGDTDKFKEELWNASFSSLEDLRANIHDFVANLNVSFEDKQAAYGELATYYHDVLVPRAERQMPRDPTSNQEDELDKITEASVNFHDEWRTFLKENKNLPWSEESVASEIERAKRLDGESAVDADALGQFIVDHGDGDAQQALNHLEDEIQEMEGMRKAINDLIGDEMGQEINDMMDEEDEEIQFAKDNPEYTTRTFDDEGGDL